MSLRSEQVMYQTGDGMIQNGACDMNSPRVVLCDVLLKGQTTKPMMVN